MSAVNSALDANTGVHKMTGDDKQAAKQSAMARSITMIADEFTQRLVQDGVDARKITTAQLVNAAARGYSPGEGWIGWFWGAQHGDGWKFYQSQAKQGTTGPLEDKDGEKYFELKTKAINPPDNADKDEQADNDI